MSRKYKNKQPRRKIRNKIKLFTKLLNAYMLKSYKQLNKQPQSAQEVEQLANDILNDWLSKHVQPIESVRFTGIISKNLITQL